jgi:ribonuclease P protein subunit POP4
MSDDNSTNSYYTNKNIVLHELIGLRVRVRESRDSLREGLSGSVINETKNTLVVDTGDGIERIPKIGSVFIFYVGNKSFIVDGREILFRPYERIKRGAKFARKRD